MEKKIIKAVAGTTLLIIVLGFSIYKAGVSDAPPVPPLAGAVAEEASRSALDQARDVLVDLRDFALTPLEKSFSRVVTPGPLNQLSAAGSASFGTPLSRAGIIAATNEERIRADMLPLTENAKLNEAARLRLEDMFKRQYFAHESPAGEGVAEAADLAGYTYIVVGENLALGGFRSDKEVVRAWIDSPAHKANMLARRYFDIGVAVREGTYKGSRARLVVQVFGTPVTACPAPSEALRRRIYDHKERIDRLEPELAALRRAIDSSGPLDKGSAGRIREYNRLAGEFNDLIRLTQLAITEYNQQVRTFNSCASTK